MSEGSISGGSPTGFSTRMRLLTGLVVMALLLGGVALGAHWGRQTSAVPTATPALTASDTGTTAGTDQATVIGTSATSPITMVGQTSAVVSTSWPAGSAAIAASSLITPEGWTVEYTTDGTTWSSTAPSPLSGAIGVRTSGSVDSQGIDGSGKQVASNASAGTPMPVAGAISGGGGGDGYSITLAGDKILNVWHHNSTTFNVDCHLRTTGTQCTQFSLSGYSTPNNSMAAYDATSKKLYGVARKTSTSEIGAVCVDYSGSSPVACSTPFVALGAAGATTVYQDIGGVAYDDTRLWMVNARANTLHCLVLATGQACGGGLNGFSLPTHGMWGGTYGFGSDLSAIGGKVYFTTATAFGCFDPVTAGYCNPTTPTLSFTSRGSIPPFPVYSSAGVFQMACNYTSMQCLDTSGNSATMPSALSTFLTTNSYSSLSVYLDASVGEWAYGENKLFFPYEKGGVATSGWASDAMCWDFTTSAACTGGDAPGFKYDVSTYNGNSGQLYAFVYDPDISCIWTNADTGRITTFGTDFGACGDDASVKFTYDQVVPRMSCDENGRVRSWQSLELTLPAGVSISDVRLTIKNSAATPVTITGWDKITPSSTTVNLSGLSVSDSGLRPTFIVTGINKTQANMVGVASKITFVGDRPELCVNLVPVTTCVIGQISGARQPIAPFTVTSIFNAVGPSTTTTTKTASVSNATALATGCATGTVIGTTLMNTGVALPLAPVKLVNPTTNAILATTTADANGNYTFTNVIAGAYKVTFGSVGSAAPLSANVPITVASAGTSAAHAIYQTVSAPAAQPPANPPAPSDPPETIPDPPATPAPVQLPLTITDEAPGSRGSGILPQPPADQVPLQVPPQARNIGPVGGRVTPVPVMGGKNTTTSPGGTISIWTGKSWVQTFTDPNVGTWTVVGDAVEFVPMPGFRGTARAWYRYVDLKGRSASSSLTMNVTDKQPQKCTLRGTHQLTVSFAVLDDTLSPADTTRIKRLTRPGCSYAVVGYVQPTVNRGNDYSLSLSRAQSVAQVIRGKKVGSRVSIVAGKRQTSEICASAQNRCVVIYLRARKPSGSSA